MRLDESKRAMADEEERAERDEKEGGDEARRRGDKEEDEEKEREEEEEEAAVLCITCQHFLCSIKDRIMKQNHSFNNQLITFIN